MPNYKNRVWDRYWRLIVISEAERSEKRKWVRWLCKCDCWNEKIVFSDELSSGKSNSCWCLKYEVLHSMWFQFKKNPDRIEQLIIYLYKSSRLKKKWLWIDYELFKKLILWKCHYCWIDNSNYSNDIRWWIKLSDTVLLYNWIDRIDSNIWYIEWNVVTCCKHCNIAKSTMPQEEFYNWIKRVYEYNNLNCSTKYQ